MRFDLLLGAFLTKLRKHFYIVSGVFHRQCSGTEIKLLV